MGGGLMQLVAYGAQDIYLTGNPQITFFKVVYRRHTNFSMESIQQTWSGTAKPNAASRVTATISRNGDLVHRLYLETYNLWGDVWNPGAYLIENVEVEIGGQTIDKHSGHWMEIWAELTEPNPSGYVVPGAHTCADEHGTLFQRMSAMGGTHGGSAIQIPTSQVNFIPLRFWFCENPGLALPLIALQYHEVKIILNTNTMVSGGNAVLWADYIYLDTDERRRFAQVSHEYLITQVQHQSFSVGSINTLNFNHPVKELVWTGGITDYKALQPLYPTSTFQLKLNGHDRFAARDRDYFTITQVWQHHSGYGENKPVGASAASGRAGVYSFALKPEEHQPSGTCNFSRIDNAQLIQGDVGEALEPLAWIRNVYAVNYNVLRIMSGMGGLAYSN
jgi:hypothetical protein